MIAATIFVLGMIARALGAAQQARPFNGTTLHNS